jgi:hypothetical protein
MANETKGSYPNVAPVTPKKDKSSGHSESNSGYQQDHSAESPPAINDPEADYKNNKKP